MEARNSSLNVLKYLYGVKSLNPSLFNIYPLK